MPFGKIRQIWPASRAKTATAARSEGKIACAAVPADARSAGEHRPEGCRWCVARSGSEPADGAGVDGPACDAGAGEGSKCLVVKLSAEVSDLSEAMRLTLRDGTERVIARLAQCVADAVEDGSLAAVEPLPTARTLYSLWLGASLLAKLHRNAEPLEQAWTASLRLLAA